MTNPKLYTAKEIAPLVGTSEKRIRVLATQRGVGQKVGIWGMWVFEKSDIPKLKPGPNGRPRKDKQNTANAAKAELAKLPPLKTKG